MKTFEDYLEQVQEINERDLTPGFSGQDDNVTEGKNLPINLEVFEKGGQFYVYGTVGEQEIEPIMLSAFSQKFPGLVVKAQRNPAEFAPHDKSEFDITGFSKAPRANPDA